MEKDLLKMNLQYFAEENPEGNEDAGNEVDPKDEGKSDEKDSGKMLTQEEFNEAMKARLARQEKEFEKKLKKEREKMRADAERYAEMSEKEKEQAELEERLKELEERERELNNRELLANIQADLTEKKLPLAFADMLLTLQDNEKIKESIEEIEEVWNEEIAEAKKANVRQPDPKDSTSSFGNKDKSTKSDFFNEGRKI